MSDLVNKYKEVRTKIQELQAEKTALVKQIFTEAAKQLFNKWPQLTNFSWRQYTPYFNDGDACVFSVNHYDPVINGACSGDDEALEITNFNEIQDEVADLLQQFDDNDFLAMFGDDAEVTVTVDGIEIEGIDHD